MKVLVTGASGFIGSALVPKLCSAGHEVFELVRYVSGGRYSFYDKENRYFADLRDREAVRRAMLDCKPHAVINLAAQTAVSFSFLNPVDVMETNFVSVVNLAECAREIGVEQFLHASTSEVYGKSKTFPLTEDMPLAATSPYAVSKIAAEHYLRLMYELYKFPITIMRPFNSYGRAASGVANRHYVVERAICQAIEKRHIHLHNPAPIRDFLFRDDHAEAYVRALGRKKLIGQAVNICTGQGYTIKQMADRVSAILGQILLKPIAVSFDLEPDRPMDIDTLIGSNGRAKRLMGWQPKYTLDKGLIVSVKEWIRILQ